MFVAIHEHFFKIAQILHLLRSLLLSHFAKKLTRFSIEGLRNTFYKVFSVCSVVDNMPCSLIMFDVKKNC